MIDSLAYILIALGILSLILASYLLYCLVGIILLKRKLNESINFNVDNIKTRLNIFIILIKKSRKVNDASSPNELNRIINKKLKISKLISIIMATALISLSSILIMYGFAMYMIAQQFKVMTTLYNNVINKDKECPCYALCTGDSSDDAYSVYELLFGPEEYNKLINLMVLNDEEYEIFFGKGRYGQELRLATVSDNSTDEDDEDDEDEEDNENKDTEKEEATNNENSGSVSYNKISTSVNKIETSDMLGPDEYLESHELIINKSSDGRKKSEFIRDHINNDMVNAYRDLVASHRGFRYKDGKNRMLMSQEELEKDLYALLSDYKVNGRNPNCKCRTAGSDELDETCLGVKHYEPGWSWDKLYYFSPFGYDWFDNFFSYDPDDPNNPYGPYDPNDPNSPYGPYDPSDPSSPYGSGPGGAPGTASGSYAVSLDDGSFYWYHQCPNGCGCVHCGDWSAAQWGSQSQWDSKNVHSFGSDGCAVYALAIGLSNLCGKEITPDIIFSSLYSANQKGKIILNQGYFSGRGIKRDVVCTKLAAQYGLQLSSFNPGSTDKTIAYIDGVLDKGGIVWTSWVDAKCAWCSNGTSHFMCIRKKDGNNYYCFTSCRGKCASAGGKEGAIQTMNYPLSKEKCVAAMTANTMYGFVNPNKPSGVGKGINFDGLAFKAEQFYTKVSFSKGTSTGINIGGAMLYNGIPWDDDGNWYRLDYEKCNAYINSVMKCNLKIGTINGDSTAGNKGCVNIDGVATHHMTWLPIMAFMDGREDGRCDNSTGWSGTRAAKYHGVAVFEKGGQLYYWPITSGDNSGHCWPNGVAHSMIPGSSSYDSKTGKVTMSLWDISWDGKKNTTVIADYAKDILSGDVYTVHLGYSSWKPPAYANKMPDYHCEMHSVCKSAFDNGGYHLKYYIIHKE